MSISLVLTRLRARQVLALVVLLGSLALGTADAHAGKGVVALIGEGGPSTAAGEFAAPSGVAVNQASGDIYVVDGTFDSVGSQRVVQFSASGDFVRAWGWGVASGAEALEVCTSSCQGGLKGAGDGQFAFEVGNFPPYTPPQVAVDQSDGSVYVADNGNNRIQKFSAVGAYLDQFGVAGPGDGELSFPTGVAVDPATGDVLVADTNNNRVQRFDSDGNYLSQFASFGSDPGSLARPMRVAVDSTGRVYTVEIDNPRVQRFTASGSFDQVFAEGIVNGAADIAIDPATDHVYIAGQNADLTVQGIHELAPDGTPVDVHAANSGIDSFPAGIAVRSATGVIYASSPARPKAVTVLDEVTPPTATIAPATDVTATSARFNGTVNPQGPYAASYHFEYSTDGSDWTELDSVEVGDGTADVAVDQVATGLDPNTDYSVRLVATKPFNAATVVSGEANFATATSPPQIRSLAAGSRTPTVVWLGGEVNPRNSQTGYYVEYTLAADTGYSDSSRVPAAPNTTDVGDGNEFVTVTELATGLQPATAYRFRVVAVNEAGSTSGPDQTFTTRQTAPTPPSGRAYEMVSPLDKNGGDVDRNLTSEMYSTSGAAVSGGAVAYASLAHFAGISGGAFQSQYRSVRGAGGWTTRGISAPVASEPIHDLVTSYVWGLSEDLSKAVVSTTALLAGNAGMLGSTWGLYLQDNSGAESRYELLNVPPFQFPTDPETVGPQLRFVFAGASRDMRHVIFEGNSQVLTPDGSEGGVYEWSDGQLRAVSKLPSGTPVGGALGAGTLDLAQMYPGDHPVSDDGQRIFFTGGSTSPGPLYVRENGAVTSVVSGSERTGDDPTIAQPAVFQAASSADGSLALFSSSSKLTDDATATGQAADLYLWDADASAGQRLTDLTTGNPGGGGVLGIAGAADDLSRVYLVARGVLAPGGVAGAPNVYLWTADSGMRHVATLASQDNAVWSRERDPSDRQFRDARVSADGSRLLLASRSRLTAYDNAGTKQLYLYDLETDRLDCVSCHSSNVAALSDSWLFYPPNLPPDAYTETPRMPLRLPRNLSADGSRAFFETAQKLVAQDTNGTTDVYMWSGGEVSLISSGRSGEQSEFIDASGDGGDVFFTTRDRLVGGDVDSQVDVYDARIGGGFPEQQVPPECVGDQCQGSPATRPSAVGPASSGLDGRGDLPGRARTTLALQRLSSAQRARLARGQRIALRLRVNRPGTVRVVATARLGGGKQTVARGSKRVAEAGVVTVGLKLSRQARRRLAGGHDLRVSLSARVRGVISRRTLRLDLGRAGR